MCGIHLIIDKKQRLEREQPNALKEMLNATEQRGPDARSSFSFSWRKGMLHLGSNRLKIIDPDARANQPMQSSDKRYVLSFNGAIYNYFDLRNELLAQGVQFSTQSDTEVLLHLLIRYGVQALNRLNGMFALVFYDSHEQKVLLARDRFGMKPLYYAQNDNYILASSSARAIADSECISKKLNEMALQQYLSFGYANAPITFFQGIYQLKAGHYMLIEGETELQSQAFTPVLKRGENNTTPKEVLSQTEELLSNAVLNHLQADVPIALMLSGGVDSTLLLSLIKSLGAHPVPTFSVINTKQEASFGTEDYIYARQAAAKYGTQHYELQLESPMLNDHHEAFLASIDQPVGDSAAFMTYLISAEIKKVAGVALSGAGADELFGGYNRHQAFAQYLQNYQAFKRFHPLLKSGAGLLPTAFAHPFRKQFRLLKKLGNSLHADPAQTFINFISQERLAGNRETDHNFAPATDGEQAFDEGWLGAALEHDLQHYLASDVLSVSDQMSMAQSLEMRMPFLDVPLSNYVRSLPATYRLQQGKKWILKSLLNQEGGKVFTKRKKEGFGLPISYWFREEKQARLLDSLLPHKQLIYEYIDYNLVQSLRQAHLSSKKDYGSELWNIWILASWLKLNFS